MSDVTTDKGKVTENLICLINAVGQTVGQTSEDMTLPKIRVITNVIMACLAPKAFKKTQTETGTIAAYKNASVEMLVKVKRMCSKKMNTEIF